MSSGCAERALIRPPVRPCQGHLPIGAGLQRCSFSIATRPHPSQTYFMAASLSLHTCLASAAGAPQKLHLVLSPQGLQRCPGSLATAPQVLHVYAITASVGDVS